MWYDLLTLAILLYTTVRGAIKGIVWQLAAIAALVLCFAFAEPLSLAAAPYIGVKPPLNRWLAMLVLYLVFSFLSFASARKLRDFIEKAKFVEYDRHVGAIFGFFKGALFCVVLTFFLVTIWESTRPAIFESRAGYAAAVILHRIDPVMPKELQEVLDPYIHTLDRPGMHDDDPDHLDSHDDDPAGSHTETTPLPFYSKNSGPELGYPDEQGNDVGANADASLDEIADRIVGVFDSSVRDAALRALKNTAPEHRPELIKKLNSGIPGLIRLATQEWQYGKPDAAEEIDEDLLRHQQMVKEIAAVYSDFPQAQETIIEDIEHAIIGLPDQVSDAMLIDWRADLMAIDPDPDTATDVTTPLDTRILRQLSRARVPLTSLTERLQDRLRASLPR